MLMLRIDRTGRTLYSDTERFLKFLEGSKELFSIARLLCISKSVEKQKGSSIETFVRNLACDGFPF
jgi:hypothetical protein